MPGKPPYLKKLERQLASFADRRGPMLLSELDGYLTGILVCSELIMPSEWLSPIWGGEGEEDEPVFESAEDLQAFLDLVMQHYNGIATDLSRGNLSPRFDVDTASGAIVWSDWMAGFGTAMHLREESWDEIVVGDDREASLAAVGMMMLVGAAHDIDAPEEGEQTVNRMAPEAIPEFVMTLHNWRIANDVARKAQSGQPVPKPSPVPPPHGFGPLDDFAAFADEPPTMARRFGKVGRNQPCPCGSGKKYKRCCGLN